MQAWSLRGAPWIFPLHDAAVYLDALCAEEGESWIYTNGLRCCQKEIGVPFSVLLQELMQCLQVLEKEPVVSKQRLDQVLAAAMLQRIPASRHIREQTSCHAPTGLLLPVRADSDIHSPQVPGEDPFPSQTAYQCNQIPEDLFR